MFTSIYQYTHMCLDVQPCPTLSDPMDCHFFFQGIFPTQESNLSLLSLLHWQAGPLPLSHKGIPYMFIGEGNGNPLQYSCLENPMDRGA